MLGPLSLALHGLSFLIEKLGLICPSHSSTYIPNCHLSTCENISVNPFKRSNIDKNSLFQKNTQTSLVNEPLISHKFCSENCLQHTLTHVYSYDKNGTKIPHTSECTKCSMVSSEQLNALHNIKLNLFGFLGSMAIAQKEGISPVDKIVETYLANSKAQKIGNSILISTLTEVYDSLNKHGYVEHILLT